MIETWKLTASPIFSKYVINVFLQMGSILAYLRSIGSSTSENGKLLIITNSTHSKIFLALFGTIDFVQ